MPTITITRAFGDAWREIQRHGTMRVEGWPSGMGNPQQIGL